VKNILIINPFDKLPGENFRDQRYTYLYEKLKQDKCCSVTWISSDFHHWSHSRRQRSSLSVEDSCNIVMIKTLAYNKNISLKRFLSHFLFSLKTFLFLLKSKRKYDAILTIAPVENLFLTSLYAKFTKVRLIIDVLDLWPDLFIEAFPKKLHFLGKILLYPYRLMADFSYKSANHITSVSKTYTHFAFSRSSRVDVENSSYFYLGAPANNERVSPKKKEQRFSCLFAGQFGHNYDIQTILEVALKCQTNQLDIDFYLAGDGFKLQLIKKYIALHHLDNTYLVGWLSSQELIDLSAKCHVGLNSYTKNATQSVPTKLFDYMSMGLCILNSLNGESANLVVEEKLGFNYSAEDTSSLYELIKQISNDSKLVTDICVRNYLSFNVKYSFDSIYNNMKNLILE